jgi:guanylate kinase
LDQVERRIVTARREMRRLSEFEYVVVNRDQELDEAVDTVLAIIKAEHCRVDQREVRL